MLENVQFHRHNGIDAPRIEPKDLLGFPIVTTVPTYSAPAGTIVLYWNGTTTYKLYAYINNTWVSTSLT